VYTFFNIDEGGLMSTQLESPVVDAVANSNFKNLGEFPTLHMQSVLEDGRIIGKQQNENLVRGSARLNGALDSLLLRAAKDIVEPDMGEAVSEVKIGTGVDVQSQGHLMGQSIAQLSAAVSSIQQLIKTALTTPPSTVPTTPTK
jgi:hypothetical protein